MENPAHLLGKSQNFNLHKSKPVNPGEYIDFLTGMNTFL